MDPSFDPEQSRPINTWTSFYWRCTVWISEGSWISSLHHCGLTLVFFERVTLRKAPPNSLRGVCLFNTGQSTSSLPCYPSAVIIPLSGKDSQQTIRNLKAHWLRHCFLASLESSSVSLLYLLCQQMSLRQMTVCCVIKSESDSGSVWGSTELNLKL